jgi:hypothetical protein
MPLPKLLKMVSSPPLVELALILCSLEVINEILRGCPAIGGGENYLKWITI